MNKIFQEGELNAESEGQAYSVLKHQGLIAVEIKEIKGNFFDKISERLEKFKVGEKFVSLFFRQLSTTLEVMNLKDALELSLLSTKNQTQQQIIKSILADIEIGKSLSEAISKYKLIFSYSVIQMIVIAQRSGRIQEISGKLAEQLEKSYKARKKLQSALYYPTFVFVVAIISMTILVNVVLPTFAGFFESQNTSLPLLTQIFLSVGVFLSENMLLIITSIILLLVSCIWIYKNSLTLQMALDKFLLKIPFIGRLISHKVWMDSFGALSFLLESGIMIDEAIDMVAASTSNLYLRSIWFEVKYEVERGGKIYHKELPAEYQGLITIGESSGTLPAMLQRCEKLSEFEVEELSNQIPVKAEIFGTLFVGIIVALIVFSVMLPVLSLNI